MTNLPNILFISLDSVRADRLSCYDYERDTTPFLQKLAPQCLLFQNAYSTTNWTLPSHVSMMTGIPMSGHGVGSDATGSRKISDPRMTTLAEYLRAYGYRTLAFTNCGWLTAEAHFDRGFEHFRSMSEIIGRNSTLYSKQLLGKYWGRALNTFYGKHIYGRQDQGGNATANQFCEWLDNSWDSQTPFFAFLHLFDSHAPYRVPTRFRQAFHPLTDNDITWTKQHVNPWYHLTGNPSLSDQQFEQLNALYDGTLSYLDYLLEKIWQHLEHAKLLDNTLIIITADHGESLGEHGAFGHAGETLYEPVIHVPLLIQLPKRCRTVNETNVPVSHLDLIPTILDVIDHSDSFLQPQLQGDSLLRLDQDADGNRVVVSQSLTMPLDKIAEIAPTGFDTKVFDQYLSAVRSGKYKMIQSTKGNVELYDLEADPQEKQNIASLLPDQVKILQRKLEKWLNSFEKYSTLEGMATELDDSVIVEQLKALGYLE